MVKVATEIKIDGKIFKVRNKMPLKLDWEVEALLLEMVGDYEGDVKSLGTDMKFKDVKDMNMEKMHEIQELLLTKCTILPRITIADIDDPDSEFQDYLKELSLELFNFYLEDQEKKEEVKKKHTSSQD